MQKSIKPPAQVRLRLSQAVSACKMSDHVRPNGHGQPNTHGQHVTLALLAFQQLAVNASHLTEKLQHSRTVPSPLPRPRVLKEPPSSSWNCSNWSRVQLTWGTPCWAKSACAMSAMFDETFPPFLFGVVRLMKTDQWLVLLQLSTMQVPRVIKLSRESCLQACLFQKPYVKKVAKYIAEIVLFLSLKSVCTSLNFRLCELRASKPEIVRAG